MINPQITSKGTPFGQHNPLAQERFFHLRNVELNFLN